jgi:succinoglycan biosynthesis protein ExoU
MATERRMTSGQASVCVVIAAKNAAGTIGRAIGSALREPQVAEVLVVDDGSSDATAGVSFGADDGTGRLRILRLETNKGPAFARNHAIENSSAPLIAILDADDFFLPGRFGILLEKDDWDFVADNIVFIDPRSAGIAPKVPAFAPEPRFLDLAAFVDGNISRRGASRGEIGFLKPVMRRAFLDAHGLRYREELRLGEDYDLYARALVRGARYKVMHSCGYGAVVRHDSLSGQHRTLDLKRLYEADRAILVGDDLPEQARRALDSHERHIRGRFELRRFLDEKRELGLALAGLRAMSRPAALPAIIGGVAGDKLDAFRARKRTTESGPAAPRYLLAARPATQR